MWAKIRSGVWEVVKFVVITLVIVIPIRAYVAQPFIVSGDSMDPTFHNREYLIIDELSYHLREPIRGEVIVFVYPNSANSAIPIHFIKRIIGLPGETVRVENGKVTIKDKANKEFTLDENYLDEPFQSNTIVKTLGADEYFVMGDNRNVSLDSRSWGALPRDLVTGRVFLRLFPPNRVSFLPGAPE